MEEETLRACLHILVYLFEWDKKGKIILFVLPVNVHLATCMLARGRKRSVHV